MKKTKIIIALSTVFLISACKKEQNINKADTGTPEKMMDSVTLKDTSKIFDSVTMKYSSQLLVFPTLKDKKLLDSIYFNEKGITDYSKSGLQKLLKDIKNKDYKFVKEDSKTTDIYYPQVWEINSRMKAQFDNNDYLHIQYYKSAFVGSAHGKYDYSERVFDLKNNKKMELSDITSISKDQLSKILYKNFNKNDKGFTDKDISIHTIPVNDNFYFDQNKIYFHYNLDKIIPGYVLGDITIPVLWEDLKGTLNPQFKERMKIK